MTISSKNKQTKTLLFIPAYNCEKQIQRVLKRIDSRAKQVIDEIIVVNNQSTDRTEEVGSRYIEAIDGIRATMLRNRDNYGLGGSHKVAFRYALENGYDHLIVLHGDDQGDLSDLIPRLEQGEHRHVDCLLGARFHPDSELVGYSRFRTFGNKVYNRIFSLASGSRLYDLGAGLNVYSVQSLDDGFYLRFADDLTFNYYMILAAVHRKISFRFFPLSWREEDQVSNVNLGRQAIGTLALLARFTMARDRFFETEHRAVPRSAYEYDIVASNTGVQPAVGT